VPSISEPRDIWTNNVEPPNPRNMVHVEVTKSKVIVNGLDELDGHPTVVRTFEADT